jgi:hypothetical protein
VHIYRIRREISAMQFGRRPFKPGPANTPLAAAADPMGPSGPERLAPRVGEAARALVEFLIDSYRDRNGGVHAETVIGAAAALTGEFAQRATGISMPEDIKQFVFGNAINDVLLEGNKDGRVTVWQCFQQSLRDADLGATEFPNIEDVVANVARAVRGPSYPPLTVPEDHYPHEWSPNACPRLRHKITAIAARHNLTRRELAFALALATGRLVAMTQEVLPPAIGITLAAEIAFGVAKMAPLSKVFGPEVRFDRNPR